MKSPAQKTVTAEALALSEFLQSLFMEVPPEAEVVALETGRQELAATRPAASVSLPAQPVPQSSAAQPETVRPDWAAQPFKIMLVDIKGMRLALPVIELRNVLPWPEGFTDIPGHAPWVLGVNQFNGQNYIVVDSAKLLIPGDYPLEEGGYRRIVLMGGGQWGLACKSVSEVITVEPDGVRWVKNRRRRPWLLGTVIEEMSALVDVTAFCRWLEQGAKMA